MHEQLTIIAEMVQVLDKSIARNQENLKRYPPHRHPELLCSIEIASAERQKLLRKAWGIKRKPVRLLDVV